MITISAAAPIRPTCPGATAAPAGIRRVDAPGRARAATPRPRGYSASYAAPARARGRIAATSAHGRVLATASGPSHARRAVAMP